MYNRFITVISRFYVLRKIILTNILKNESIFSHYHPGQMHMTNYLLTRYTAPKITFQRKIVIACWNCCCRLNWVYVHFHQVTTSTPTSSLASTLSRRSLSSDSVYLASPVIQSTGPFSVCNFIARYNTYRLEPAKSWKWQLVNVSQSRLNNYIL